MKIKKYIYIAAAAILSSCQSEEIIRYVYTVGEADNAIQLSAGISDGHSGVMTRAGAEDHHASHLPFTANTQVRLRVDGTWTGHDPVDITKTTTATIGAETSNNSKHNAVSFSNTEKLYWDDYGTADPVNASTGRTTGLTIYGVAVDGATTAPSVSNWTSLSWTLDANQTSGWAAKDLLTSNNVKDGGPDGTYKFTDRNTGKLLEFTHAMTKITVNLKAGEGFVDGKFVNKPTVTLLQFYYTGTYNIESKTPAATTGSKTNINAHLAQVKATYGTAEWSDAPATWASSHMAKFDALVFPGNQFEDNTDILKLEVDGNTLYVNATNINAANTESSNTFEQGKNYILNITVNKTDIEVTATIKDWVDVETENVTPKINVNEVYGHPTQDGHPAFQKEFDLYRSTSINGSFLGTDDHSVVSYADSKYTMSPQLYWPTHSTHYFFRGVWPKVDSKDNNEAQLGPTTAQVKANAIDVQNVAYQKGYYPSDLMIARPLNVGETATDEACKVHSGTQGICATTGDIRMNFRYMMSQIIVELSSSASTDPNYIVFDSNTKVEIIGGYKDGTIKLSDCTSDFTGKTVAPYELHNKDANDYDSYHDAVIPQALTNGMKFRITVKNSDGSTDTYETAIKDIKVKEGTANPALISAWASGKAYTYNLKLTKTEINVTATITDWVTVNASGNIWF